MRDTTHVLRIGLGDPTVSLTRNQFVFAQHTPLGPVEVELTQLEQGAGKVAARCWGPGSEWIVEQLPRLLGVDDDPTTFQPTGPLRQLHQKHIGMRMTRLPLVASQVTKVVLMQLVAWRDAQNSWCRLAKRLGMDSPGPSELRLPPRLADIRSLRQFEMIECGVIPKLARTLKNVAAAERHLEHAATVGPDAFATCMHKIHGIGEWTTQYVLGTAMGQADALLTGDYGMPHTISWFFTRQDRSDDARMIELLEPFSGNRFRVVRLMWIGGIQAPRHGPRAGSVRQRMFRASRSTTL